MELTGMNPLQRAALRQNTGVKPPSSQPADTFQPTVATNEPRFGVSFNWSQKYRTHKLLKAARKNDVALAQKQLDAGVSVNSRDRLDMTGLMYGAEMGHERMVNFLLDKGADAKLASKTGRTALLYSVFAHGDQKTPPTAALVDKLADVSNLNHQDIDGNTALVLAAKNGLPEAADRLISKGADVKIANKAGMTSLMYAAWNGDAELVEKIALAVPVQERSEFVNAQNKYKHSALDFAANWKRKDIAALLIRLGAKAKPEVAEWATKPGENDWPTDFDIVEEYLKRIREEPQEEAKEASRPEPPQQPE